MSGNGYIKSASTDPIACNFFSAITASRIPGHTRITSFEGMLIDNTQLT